MAEAFLEIEGTMSGVGPDSGYVHFYGPPDNTV